MAAIRTAISFVIISCCSFGVFADVPAVPYNEMICFRQQVGDTCKHESGQPGTCQMVKNVLTCSLPIKNDPSPEEHKSAAATDATGLEDPGAAGCTNVAPISMVSLISVLIGLFMASRFWKR